MPTATAEHRATIVEQFTRDHGGRSVREQLGEPCPCGASPGHWCRRRGRGIVGHIHPDRGTLTT